MSVPVFTVVGYRRWWLVLDERGALVAGGRVASLDEAGRVIRHHTRMALAFPQ